MRMRSSNKELRMRSQAKSSPDRAVRHASGLIEAAIVAGGNVVAIVVLHQHVRATALRCAMERIKLVLRNVFCVFVAD